LIYKTKSISIYNFPIHTIKFYLTLVLLSTQVKSRTRVKRRMVNMDAHSPSIDRLNLMIAHYVMHPSYPSLLALIDLSAYHSFVLQLLIPRFLQSPLNPNHETTVARVIVDRRLTFLLPAHNYDRYMLVFKGQIASINSIFPVYVLAPI
jgi:hypothetical protein